MGTKYSSLSVVGFNASPPPDDGSTGAANKVTWATIKTKLGDPLNTFDSTLNTALINAFDTAASAQTGTYSTVAADNGRVIECAGTFTLSLADAATLGAGWLVTIKVLSGVVTIGRVTGGNTIDGVAANLTMKAGQTATFSVNQAANGFNSNDNNALIFDPTDITKSASFDVSGVPTTTGVRLKVAAAGVVEGQHGTDVASASTLNLDTATGDIVDVTGTTTITAITLTEGRERTVRFTGILTITAGASLVLPGPGNITTAAGDLATFRGYAGGVVLCSVYTPISGLSPAAGFAKLASGTSGTGTNCDIDFSTFTTYQNLEIRLTGFTPGTDIVDLFLRTATVAAPTVFATGASNYAYVNVGANVGGGSTSESNSTATEITICGAGTVGNAAAESLDAVVYLFNRTDTTKQKKVLVLANWLDGSTTMTEGRTDGQRTSTSDIGAVRFIWSSGNHASGTWALYGYK